MEPLKPLCENVQRKLEEVNWISIYPRLVRHALYRVRGRYWRRNDGENLAKGFVPEDIAQQAIHDLFGGIRTWDPNKDTDLLTFLKYSVIDSIVDGLARSGDNLITGRFPESMNDDGVVLEPTNVASPDAKHATSLLRVNPTPENILEETQEAEGREREAKVIVNAILDAARGDEEVMAILEYTMEGVKEPRFIAKSLGVPVGKIYAAQKRLNRIAQKARQEFLPPVGFQRGSS